MASETMASEEAIAVMRKIAKASRGPTEQAGMTSGRAWRQSLPKSSEEHVGLIASVKSFETEVVPLDVLLAQYDERFLMTTLGGPRGAQGLAMADPALLASLIEVQTMGRVLGAEPPERAPSDTDVALVGHVIDRWSADQERALHDGGGLAPFRGFRVKDRLEDARAASLHLE
ncbi:MAG: hypothetical protein KJN93_09345, partial [Alphaproteobacteria bacterium]|nr:hypothetical protein [Alphaproteobacteria bacterium]